MKHLLSILIVCVTLSQAHSQGMVQANKGVFNNSIFLKDRWVKGVSTNINSPDSSSHDKIPTAKTVYQWVKEKVSGFQNFATADLTFEPNVSRFHTMQGGMLAISGGSLIGFNTLSNSGDTSSSLNLNTRNSGLMPGDPRAGFHSVLNMRSYSLLANSGLWFNHSKAMLYSEKFVGPTLRFAYLKATPDSVSIHAGTLGNLFIQGLQGLSTSSDKVLVLGTDGKVKSREQKDIEECKVYVAKFKATGGGANPTVTVFKNTIGTITWTAGVEGTYFAQSAALFTTGKTFLSLTPGLDNVLGGIFHYGFTQTDNSEVMLSQNQNGAGVDVIQELWIEIRIYP